MMLYLKVLVYIPGLARHQHLLVQAGYQKQQPLKYYIPINRLDFPRGYPSAVSSELRTFSVDYAFPLAYPDLALGPVLYLKRLRADVFHDRSYGWDIQDGSGEPYSGRYLSTGTELLADFHFARFILPLSAGIRLGYLHDENRIFSEFLFTVRTPSQGGQGRQ
jgi:hypothetical protein